MVLVNIIGLVFQVYILMLFAKILSSWLPELNQYRFMQFISFYTDPYLNFFRNFIPPLGMIDISPIFAFLALGFIEYILKLIVLSFL